MASKTTNPFPLEELRRFAVALGVAAGLAPAKASTLAGLLLWSDEAGRPEMGLATLADWLDRLNLGEFDPKAEASVARPEPASTATLIGPGVLPPLLLERAGEIASEKAREGGLGLVRIVGLADPGASASAVAAGLAVGPTAALILGPGRAVALALSTAGSLPIVFDSRAIAASERSNRNPIPGLAIPLMALVGERDGLVLAAAASTLFGDESPLDRLRASGADDAEGEGLLLPGPWADRRRQAREEGLPVARPARDRLKAAADRLGVAVPWGRR